MAVQTLTALDQEKTLESQLIQYPVCHITYNRDSWVKLLELPSEYSYYEAKLLCRHSENAWVAWVPDHGEAVLERSQFYC